LESTKLKLGKTLVTGIYKGQEVHKESDKDILEILRIFIKDDSNTISGPGDVSS
jgi:hypothetical protein